MASFSRTRQWLRLRSNLSRWLIMQTLSETMLSINKRTALLIFIITLGFIKLKNIGWFISIKTYFELNFLIRIFLLLLISLYRAFYNRNYFVSKICDRIILKILLVIFSPLSINNLRLLLINSFIFILFNWRKLHIF